MKKIMFNDKYGLTQAVLDGHKTMTRRIVPKHIFNKIKKYQEEYYDGALATISEEDTILALCTYEHCFKPPYQVGEVVAIAQSYKDCVSQASNRFGLRDNLTKGLSASAGWCNKMFVKADLMPHHIRITNIRIERLQDISDEDCLREGIFNTRPTSAMFGWDFNTFFNNPREAFSILINKISGKGTWERNPYVFVYEFELVD